MKLTNVHITEEIIIHCNPMDSKCCMVALALKNAVGNQTFVCVGVKEAYISNCGDTQHVRLPKVAQNKITTLINLPRFLPRSWRLWFVKPFSFTVPVKESLLHDNQRYDHTRT